MTALYTALYGDYDDLGLLVPQDPPAECVCFTDDPGLEGHPPWTIICEKGRFDQPRMSAKWYKLMPHLLFPEYDHSLWVDASMYKPNPGLVRWAIDAIGPGGIAAFRHPYFDDIYGDAELSATLPKYEKEPIIQQVAAYRTEGFPEHYGHFAAGTLARRHNALASFDEAWWRECERWSVQDQLSLPVVAWRAGVKIEAFDGEQLDNPYISPGGHRHHDR